MGGGDVGSMEASFPSDGLWWWRWWRMLRGSIGEVCLPQPDAIGLVVLHPVLGLASSALMDFSLETVELFFFTDKDVANGLSTASYVLTLDPACCLLRYIQGLGPLHWLGKESFPSVFCAPFFMPPIQRQRIGSFS